MTMDGVREDPGAPVSEHRLRAWVSAQTAPTGSDIERARAQVSGRRPEAMTKRSLIAVSHAIERAVLASPVDGPTVVIGLFQRMEYFERERSVYRDLAEAGVRVAVGFCDAPAHDLPDGVEQVALDPSEALVDEWAIVALSDSAGAFLVATDRHEFDPDARSLEAGRRFLARWGFSRVQSGVELARLRLTLGARLHPGTLEVIDRLLMRVMPAGADPAGSAGSPQERWFSTAALHLADRMDTARAGSARLRAQLTDAHAAAAARATVGVDQQSGLTTPEFLQRWSDTGGTTALPVGLAMFELPAVQHAVGNQRAAYHAARRIAAAMTEPLGPVDAAVRLSEREFLVVVPGASEMHLATVCDEIVEQLALASDGYPYVSLAGGLATVVTRARPLPLADLRRALERLEAGTDTGPVDAGTSTAGDRITICVVGDAPTAAPSPVPTPRPRDDGSSLDPAVEEYVRDEPSTGNHASAEVATGEFESVRPESVRSESGHSDGVHGEPVWGEPGPFRAVLSDRWNGHRFDGLG
ncbi:diguanylate cyclase/two-component system sensory protein [Pseudonocardia sediminis]|uniref:Diguanylate cyclase/two-component system sensory protein n=1 Tax=Pseudonocardia sediminis TaxID=1397368 RepID=A0A4Q7UP22_PSEST|nr:diguanylate cyclase/two-component system sensory protein [Pseudonocardia sediminis]